MNVELKELSAALFSMRNGYLPSVIKESVKDIEAFIQAIEKVVIETEFLISDDVLDNMARMFNTDDDGSNVNKEMFLETRKIILTDVKIIMDFIHKSDRNKQFLDGYIKHIDRYFHRLIGNIINNHPFLTTQSLAKMFMDPYIVERNGRLVAMHYYIDDEPRSINDKHRSIDQFDELFSIDFCMGMFQANDTVTLPSHKILKLEYAGAVSIEIKEAIKTYLEYAINEDIRIYESNNCYTLTHPLDDEFSLILFLPKDYFRLKK